MATTGTVCQRSASSASSSQFAASHHWIECWIAYSEQHTPVPLNVICKPAFLRSRSRILPHLVPLTAKHTYLWSLLSMGMNLYLTYSNCGYWNGRPKLQLVGTGLCQTFPLTLVTSYLHRNCLDFHHTSVQIVKISEMVRLQVKSYVNVFVRVVDLTLGHGQNKWSYWGRFEGQGLSSTMTWQQHMLETLETLDRRFGCPSRWLGRKEVFRLRPFCYDFASSIISLSFYINSCWNFLNMFNTSAD